MNCDQAFDLMTDPALDDSTALHEHLDVCPRCQQMYETLSPALGLFAPAETLPSPTFDESESAQSVEIAQRVAVSLSQAPNVTTQTHRRGRILAVYAAAGVISFATALGLLMMFSAPSVPAPLQPAECTWLNRDAAGEQQSAAVVRSCVACHLSDAQASSDARLPDSRVTVLAGLIN